MLVEAYAGIQDYAEAYVALRRRKGHKLTLQNKK